MILGEGLNTYLEGLIDLRKDDTDSLYNEQKSEDRPIIHRSTSIFLRQIIEMKNPKKVLEFGTNGGYSATCMAKSLKGDALLTTIEFRPDHAEVARANFKKHGVENKIKLLNGRAEEIIEDLDEMFDIVFIDADKKGYPLYLEYAMNHLNEGGIILVDNLLWKGAMYSYDAHIMSKPSTITIKEFNRNFMNLKGYMTQILPIGDGLGYAVKL